MQYFDIFILSATPIVLPPVYEVQLHKNILDLHNLWTSGHLGDALHAIQSAFLQNEKFICSFYFFQGVRNS